MQDREAACQAWMPYVRQIADTFGLRDWTIEISPEAPGADDLATMAPVQGSRVATMELSDNFLAGAPDVQRQIVLHELLHCHMAHQDWLAFLELSEATYRPYELAAEYTVDAIATAIAPFFPLPNLKG